MAGPNLSFTLVAVGGEKAELRLRRIAKNMENLDPVWGKVANILQAGEVRHFARLRGRYVLTGRVRDSLTLPYGNDIIRRAHGDSFVFGSKVWYAQFLRKGTTKRSKTKHVNDRGGVKLKKVRGKSAVLVLLPKERKQVSEVIMDHLMGRS